MKRESAQISSLQELSQIVISDFTSFLHLNDECEEPGSFQAPQLERGMRYVQHNAEWCVTIACCANGVVQHASVSIGNTFTRAIEAHLTRTKRCAVLLAKETR